MNRTELIQKVIDQIGAKSYLEIGTQYGYNFNKIQCAKKVGVDPGNYEGKYIKMTSDDYFKQCKEAFDVIFIDGLHHADQVLLDVENSFNHITKNAVVILHDCNPRNKETQQIPETHMAGWTGNVWRAWINLRRYKSISCVCIDICTGMGIILQKPSKGLEIEYEDTLTMTYEEFDKNREELLNLKPKNYFNDILKSLPKI